MDDGIFYKIVELNSKGQLKSLFHGINGSRVFEPGAWIIADKKIVSDGSTGTKYLSGLHVMKTKEECEAYLSKFTNVDRKTIVKCQCRGIRVKEHSTSNVFLVDEMLILEG